jgi:hypothetical protein
LNHQIATVEGHGHTADVSEALGRGKDGLHRRDYPEDGESAVRSGANRLARRAAAFYVVNGKIDFQRGYWDKLSFRRLSLPGSSG